MRFLSRLDDFENIIIDGSVSTSGLSSVYIKDATTPILRIGSNTGDSFITYDGTELSVSSDVDLRLTTPTDQDVFLITSSGNIVTTQGGGNFTIGGGLTLGNFGAGYLKTDANGVVSIDTDIIEDTLDSVTDRGATTTNNISVGELSATGGIINLGTANTSSGHINAYENMTFNIDSDNDDTNRYFAWYTNGNAGGGSELMRLTEAGNVGIGTTAPVDQLAIGASSSVAGFSVGSGLTQVFLRYNNYFNVSNQVSDATKGTATIGIGRSSDGVVTFWTAAAGAGAPVERMRITSGGNVGIGTTAPNTWKLSVDSSTIYAASFDTSNNVGVVINGNDTTASQIIGFSDSASTYNALHLRTNSTSTSGLYINTSGNVGIGLTAPTEKLHVSGNILATGTINASNFSGSSSGTNTGDQTTITGNAGSATVLQTARTLTIGNTGKTFDGSANVSWTLAEIGAYAATNPAGYTTNTGTVTSVSGAGGYGGLTLTGAVTTSGDITLGGTPTGTWPIDVSGNAATATEVSRTVAAGSEANVVSATIGTNDFFRIRTGGASNAGFVEIATADDATEPIYVRQYTGTFATLTRTATILDGSGNTSFPGTLTASNFSGSSSGTNTGDQTTITGNAGSATVLQTARTINGTSFDGSANITTTNWGTTRTVTIGNTGKSVNGSADVSWSLAEIGAQPAGSYLTAEADTLATVTGRGASTSTQTTFSGNVLLEKSSGNNILHITSAAGGTPVLYMTSPSRGWGQYVDVNDLHFKDETGNIVTMVLKAGGNVGINTTNPTAKLEISGFSTGAGLKLNYGNSSGTIEAVNFIANGGANGVIGMQMVSAGVGDLWLGGSGGRTLTLYRDGNVGIGADSPTQKLQVDGAIRLTSNPSVTGDGSSAQFWNGAGVGPIIAGANFQVRTNGNTTALHINSSQNVGIGTTGPNQKLDIRGYVVSDFQSNQSEGAFFLGNSLHGLYRANLSNTVNLYTTSGDLRFSVDNRATTHMIVSSSGSVGIGTTAPAYKLDVVAGDIRIMNVAGPTLNFSDNVDQNWDIGVDATTNDFYFKNGISGVRHVTIDNGGNTGVGTTNPDTKLHVVGTAETRLRVGSSNASSNVVLELRDENSPTGQGTVITYNNATGETYFNNALSTATTDFHFQSGEYGTASDFFALSNAGGNSIVQLSTATGDAFITYEDAINELAIASDGDLRLTTPTDQDVFYISSGGNIDMTQAGGNVDMGGQLTVDGNGIFNSKVGIGQTNLSADVGLYVKKAAGTVIKSETTSTNGNPDVWIVDADNNSARASLQVQGNGGAIESLFVASNGNVGMGTVNPSFKLDVAGTFQSQGNATFNGSNVYINSDNTVVGNNTTDVVGISGNTMYFPGNGNIGIGTTSPQQALHIFGATNGYAMIQGGSDSGQAGLYFKKEDTTGTMARTKGLIVFHTNVGSGWGRGHLGFCLNSADSTATVSISDEKFRMVDNGDFLADGDVVAYSTTISDARYKTNIQPIESALDKVNQMRGVSFDWTAVRSGREFGVIAQEIEQIAPEVVSEKELLNGDTMKTVSYTSLVPFLIESIKELTQQVNELKAQLDGLTK